MKGSAGNEVLFVSGVGQIGEEAVPAYHGGLYLLGLKSEINENTGKKRVP